MEGVSFAQQLCDLARAHHRPSFGQLKEQCQIAAKNGKYWLAVQNCELAEEEKHTIHSVWDMELWSYEGPQMASQHIIAWGPCERFPPEYVRYEPKK